MPRAKIQLLGSDRSPFRRWKSSSAPIVIVGTEQRRDQAIAVEIKLCGGKLKEQWHDEIFFELKVFIKNPVMRLEGLNEEALSWVVFVSVVVRGQHTNASEGIDHFVVTFMKRAMSRFCGFERHAPTTA